MAEEPVGPYGALLETRLRVLTWNLWWRYGPWEARLPAIEATLRAVDPDVCALQEVWELPDGTSSASHLADALGYEHVYAHRLELPAGEQQVRFGNAILSRWPITTTEHWPLPSQPGAEELRTLLYATIDGPRGRFQVFCTHLNWRFDQSDIRQQQVKFVCETIESLRPRDYPPILCGDMNAPPDSTEMWMLTGKTTLPVPKLVLYDAWEVAGVGPGHTWSNDNPYARLDLEVSRRIDYVFSGWPRAAGAGHCVRASMVGVDAVNGVVPSDHYGVVAELRY